MSTRGEWVLKITWLVYPLTLWLKLPGAWRVRVVLPAVIISSLSVAGYVVSVEAAKPPTNDMMPDIASTSNWAGSRAAILPGLSSVALLETTRHLNNPEVHQQHGQFNLTFTTGWEPFAEFSNQIVQSNLAPISYRLQWQPQTDAGVSPTAREFKVQLQLSPGVYQLRETDPALWVPENTQNQTPPLSLPQCPTPPAPDFILQASWPSRGYIQVIFNGQDERIEINQLLGNSWQLLRIGSDSLGFRLHNADASCDNQRTITVAI